MIKPERVAPDLPELDRTDDPRGGAAALALLVVGAVLIVGTMLVVIWFW